MDANIAWKVGEDTWLVVRNGDGHPVAVFKFDQDAIDYVLVELREQATCNYEPRTGATLSSFTIEAVYLPDMDRKLKM